MVNNAAIGQAEGGQAEMSRIYFHSQDGTAEVFGAERAHMGVLIGDLFVASLGALRTYDRTPVLWPVVTGYIKELPIERFYHSFSTWASGFDAEFIYKETTISGFESALNTALAIGSDPLKLMARLHGQCEIHTYVEGQNRAWLADIIESGRTHGIMRANMKWESVIELLRDRDDLPVVTSYSVCEQFPNPGIAGWEAPEDEEGEPNYDAWYELPHDEQWGLAMAGLRATTKRELSPDTWQSFHFTNGITAFDILEHAYSLRNV